MRSPTLHTGRTKKKTVEDCFNAYLGYLQCVFWCTSVWFMLGHADVIMGYMTGFMLGHVDVLMGYMT